MDKATSTAVESSIRMDNPVVAPTTSSALSWLGAVYLIALLVLGYAADVLGSLTSLPSWAEPGMVAVAVAIIRVLERVVRFQLQQRGES